MTEERGSRRFSSVLGVLVNFGLARIAPPGLPPDQDQKLLRLEFDLNPRMCRIGENQVEIFIDHREPYGYGGSIHNIVLEKLEVHLDYK